MIQCRTDCGSTGKKMPRDWDDHDWMEWHANRLSSAILMPRSAVERLVEGVRSERRESIRRATMVFAVAESFDVSFEAAMYRLKDLGFIPKNDTTNFMAVVEFLDANFI